MQGSFSSQGAARRFARRDRFRSSQSRCRALTCSSSAAPSFNAAIGGCFPARIQEPHRLHCNSAVLPEVPQAALLTLDSLMCQLLQRLRLVLMSSPLVHQALARVPP